MLSPLGSLSFWRSSVISFTLVAASLSVTSNRACAAVTESASNLVTTISLSLQDVDSGVLNWAVSVSPQTTPFQKEPAAAGRIHRGSLSFGGSQKNPMPFLWLRSTGKLFLDLNGNGDLTDDAAGSFSTIEPTPDRYQTFQGIRIPVVTASGVLTQLLDLHLYDYSDQLNASAAVRTFWQGHVILDGADLQMGVVQMPAYEHPGYLVVRPWERRDKPLSVQQDGALEALSFAKRVYVGGRMYQCEFIGPSPGNVAARLQLTRQDATLGELQLAGKFIHRLVLQGSDKLVILDRPEPTVQVPVGSYSEIKIWLQEGGVAAYRDFQRIPSIRNNLLITTNQPAALAAGGPLTNSIAVTRRGGNLLLNYQLLGLGGEAYQLAARDYSKPPEFTVFSGEKQIATGKFEFG